MLKMPKMPSSNIASSENICHHYCCLVVKNNLTKTIARYACKYNPCTKDPNPFFNIFNDHRCRIIRESIPSQLEFCGRKNCIHQ